MFQRTKLSKNYFVPFFFYCFFVSAQCIAVTLEDVTEVLSQRDSVIQSFRYEMTQIKRRLPEGMEILSGNLLEENIKKRIQDGVVRDFTRIRDGEKDFVEEIIYGENNKTISGKKICTWDGNIGRRYEPHKEYGRVEQKHFKLDADTVDAIQLEIFDKPLYVWLREKSDNIQLEETADGMMIQIEIKGTTVRYLLAPDKGFLPKKVEFFAMGGLKRSVIVEEFAEKIVDGISVFVPIKIKATTYAFKEKPIPGKKPNLVPLLETEIMVHSYDLNISTTDDQFTLDFPPGTTIYDEFLNQHIPKPDSLTLNIESLESQINEQAEALSKNYSDDPNNTKKGVSNIVKQADKVLLTGEKVNSDLIHNNYKYYWVCIILVIGVFSLFGTYKLIKKIRRYFMILIVLSSSLFLQRVCIADTKCDTCGTINTYFVSKLYGIQPPNLCEIVGLIDQARDGTATFKGIAEGLKKLGLETYASYLSFEELAQIENPTIIQLITDNGPHFVTFGKIREGKVIVYDPPKTKEFTKKQFADQWSGAAIVVLPVNINKKLRDVNIENIKTHTSKSSNNGILMCQDAIKNLGKYILPLRKVPTAEFVIENISRESVEIGEPIKSCACIPLSISKTYIAPGEKTKIEFSISNSANISGNKRYTIDIPLQNKNQKPIRLEILIEYEEMISVRPLRMYFGRVFRSEMPLSNILKINNKSDRPNEVKITSIHSSVPWIKATNNSETIKITVLQEAPIGLFNENIQIETTIGSINIPVTGECVGNFRVVPNPLILWTSKQDKSKFTITKTHNSNFNFKNLVLLYEKDDLNVSYTNTKANDDKREYTVDLLNKKGSNSHHVKIYDPISNEAIMLNIVALSK